MATERLPMRQLREMLRQKLVMKRSHRQVAASLGISNGTVCGASVRARVLGLDWEQICALSDDALEERLYGPKGIHGGTRPLPDAALMHVELRRVATLPPKTWRGSPRRRRARRAAARSRRAC